MKPTTTSEAKLMCRLSGPLLHQVRVGPQKVWRRQFVTLDVSENQTLCLSFFIESTGGLIGSLRRKSGLARLTTEDNEVPVAIKLKSEMEMEKGCEARELTKDDVSGKENCFMVVTSKTQIKFQALSLEDRDRWVLGLAKEFERLVETNFQQQKEKLLRKGATMNWYRPAKQGGMLSIKVSLDESISSLRLGDLTNVPIGLVDSVVAGDESDLYKMPGNEVFHFNCFVLKLKKTCDEIYPGCVSLDFEAQKQSTRDDWVSALEGKLKDTPQLPEEDQTRLSANNAASPKSATLMGDKKISTPLIGEIPKLLSRKGPSVLGGDDANKASENSFSSVSTSMGSSEPNKTRSETAFSMAENDDDDEDEGKGGGGGVGELFKQKIKLGANFPYSRCISFAMESTLQGEKAGIVLTPDRDITIKELEEVVHYNKFELPLNDVDLRKIAQTKKKAKPVVFDMTEYTPSGFKELRNRWGITDYAYFRSLSQLSGDGAIGDGKSGMLFFFTRDRRYVLKTVKTNEMTVLVDNGLLKTYVRHMADNPDSLICRFFGLYTFKMGKPAREINLVCMQNSFDTRLVLHEKYDLKGSTANRWCTPRFGSVLKDLNFGNSKLYLDSKDRVDFLKQCERDTAILEQFNVMDYSLLLGVHKPTDTPEKVQKNLLLLSMASQLEVRISRRTSTINTAPTKPSPAASSSVRPNGNRWQRDFGGIQGVDPDTQKPQVYIMQIIDLLQSYDTGKRLENLIKSQMTEEVSEISAVNPKTYRARFLAYMAKIVVGVDYQNAVIATQRRDLRMRMFTNQDVAGKRRPSMKLSLPVLDEDASEETDVVAPTVLVSAPTLITVSSSVAKSSSEQQPPSALRKGGAGSVRATASGGNSRAGASISFSSNPVDETGVPSSDEVDLNPNEPELKAEIAAAIAEAEQEKLLAAAAGGDLGGAFTEVLEDGTEVTILEDGGFIQRMVDGVVLRRFPDGHVVQQNLDGSRIETTSEGMSTHFLPDGTIIVHADQTDEDIIDVQTNPDGTRIESLRDGGTRQINPEGTIIETGANGDKRTIYKNGTTIEKLSSGATRQTNGDGTMILTLADGVRIQTDSNEPHLVLTIKVDGTSIQDDKRSGLVITTFVNGNEFHKFPDGSTIHVEVRRDGKYVKQSNADGSIFETMPDGSTKFTGKS